MLFALVNPLLPTSSYNDRITWNFNDSFHSSL